MSCRPGTNDEEEEKARAARVSEALACPCLAELKRSPCGPPFVAAFSCFHLSTAQPRGCDCLMASLAFASCLREHPTAVDPSDPSAPTIPPPAAAPAPAAVAAATAAATKAAP